MAVKGICNTVDIDIIGPVQTSAKGNRYITCVVYLIKDGVANAVPNKAPKTVADFFWEDILCCHGNAVTVISCQLLKIDAMVTPANNYTILVGSVGFNQQSQMFHSARAFYNCALTQVVSRHSCQHSSC